MREQDQGAELRAWRAAVASSMQDTAAAAVRIDGLEMGLRAIGSRLPALQEETQPLAAIWDDANRLSRRVDATLVPVRALVQGLGRLRGLEKELEQDEDMERTVAKLDEVLGIISSSRSSVSEELQGVLGSSVLEARRRRKLMQFATKIGGGGDEEGRALMAVAMVKLQAEFVKLLAEGGDKEPVAAKLNAIVKRIASGEAAQDCVSAFVEHRSRALRLGSASAPALREGDVEEWSRRVQQMVNLLHERERRLSKAVFGGVADEQGIGECIAMIAEASGIEELVQVGERLARNSSAGAPEGLFKLLEMFETLQNISPAVQELWGPQAGPRGSRLRARVRELQKSTVQAAYRAFHAFERKVAKQTLAKQVELRSPPKDAGVHSITRYVVSYIEYLVSSSFYKPVLEQVLRIERIWKESDSPSPSPNPNNANLIGGGGKLVDSQVAKIIDCLSRAIDEQSNWYAGDSVRQNVFVMNNIYHVFRAAKRCEQLGSILGGDAWLRDRRLRVREAATKYQRQTWSKLLLLLNREVLCVDRDLVRHQLDAFSTELEHIVEHHQGVRIRDPELRSATCGALVHGILPVYRSYLQSYGSLVTGCVLLSPDRVERLLRSLFDDDDDDLTA